MVPATLSIDEAARRNWDVVIIGAGPAGALAARLLGGRGASVLLVERADFPRDKVCGCCLNAAALALLRAAKLGDLPDRLGAIALQTVNLSVRGRAVELALPGGCSLSRRALDTALVREAIAAGVAFLPRTSAEFPRPDNPRGDLKGTPGLRSGLVVQLRQNETPMEVHSRLVLVAAGLASRQLRLPQQMQGPAEKRSWIGVAATVQNAPDAFRPGSIFMACGTGGYVGAVRLETGQLNVAAALDPASVRRDGGPARSVLRIATEAGWPSVPELSQASWSGTPALTGSPPQSGRGRVLLLGDSAGYVEPFTGEGIAWALASGLAVVPLALRALAQPSFAIASAWNRRHRALFRVRHIRCRIITRLLRFPRLLQAVLAILSLAPGLALPVIARLNRLPPPARPGEHRP